MSRKSPSPSPPTAKPELEPLVRFPLEQRRSIRHVLTDIDDTLTREGRLQAEAYTALERLQAAGLNVVAVTGRPAGWCDHIARMWPLAGVVGENGALYYRYDAHARRMERRYWKSATERAQDRRRLEAVQRDILAQVPGSAVATDQAWREADLAIDFCEDVPPLPREAVLRIAGIFHAAGASAKISSIHVNGWFGDYDKLSMSRVFFREALGVDLDAERERTVYCGDSPNDEPMFAHFPHGVGVANVRETVDLMRRRPRWITERSHGEGFAELAAALLEARGGCR